MAGGRGLAGCGHLLVWLLGPLLLLLARSGTRALVCLPCDESKCEEPRNCPGSIVQGVCGCCYMCARQRNESCGGAYGLHGACDRGLRCVIRPPLNGDSITEYEVGVCEGRALRHGPLPTWPAPSLGAQQSLAETLRREDSAGEGAPPTHTHPGPREGAPRPSVPARCLPPRSACRGGIGFRGWRPGERVGGVARGWPIGLGLRAEVRPCAPRWGCRGQGHCGGCREPRGEAGPRRPPHGSAVWDRVPRAGREILWAEETCLHLTPCDSRVIFPLRSSFTPFLLLRI